MRDIPASQITETIRDLCIEACTVLTPDMCAALEAALARETDPAGRLALEDIVENYRCAAREALPICQDTGMAVVFAELGQEVHISGGDFTEAVNEGVRRGYREGCLRKSVVADPFRRVNTEDNTPAVLHLRLVPGDRLRLTLAPKGFGSENKSAARMFLPSAPVSAFEDFIVETARVAGGNPCPPMVLGVGIGGTLELAALNAKRALLTPADAPNPDPFYAELEARALARINSLGI
ncbi:MAG: fumarate hydratase, partial [bacterium]